MHSNVIEQRMQAAHDDFAARGQAVADILNICTGHSPCTIPPDSPSTSPASPRPRRSGRAAARSRRPLPAGVPRRPRSDDRRRPRPAGYLARAQDRHQVPARVPERVAHGDAAQAAHAGPDPIERMPRAGTSHAGAGAVGGGPDRLQSYASVDQVEGEQTMCRVKSRLSRTGTTVDLQLDRVPADLAVRILQPSTPLRPWKVGSCPACTRADPSPGWSPRRGSSSGKSCAAPGRRMCDCSCPAAPSQANGRSTIPGSPRAVRAVGCGRRGKKPCPSSGDGSGRCC